jgi:hypothetical protein
MEKFVCAKCGKHKEVKENGGTGYGINNQEQKICYECCAIDDQEYMDTHDRYTLYLTYKVTHNAYTDQYGNKFGERREYEVTNWPGTLRYKCCVKKGNHNMTGSRYDVWFKDKSGNNWHGIQYGKNTQLCHCKKLKPR